MNEKSLHPVPSAGSPITEADLHAYADGQWSPARHAEVDAFLASHPQDQTRVADWQAQRRALHALLDPVLDEPSAILDEGEIETLFEVVRRLTTEGVGGVYITPRLDEIRRIGDRVTVLTDGRTAATGIASTTPTDELVELMVGRKVERLYPDRPPGSERVLLEVRGLRRLPMVRGVSLEVRAGEVLGLGGLVGSGRSELLRLIYGIDAPEEGEVLIEGERLAPNRPDRAIAAGLGLAPEDRKSQGLLLEWSMTKNVSLADLGRFIRPLLNVRAERAAAAEQLRELNTVPYDPDRIVRELSGGNQQKVVLARWLLRHCRVLLLDEPTRGG